MTRPSLCCTPLRPLVGFSIVRETERQQNDRLNEGMPKIYEGRASGFKVISVDSPFAYRTLGVERYQRTLLMNTYELGRPYVVDVFQVKGGRTVDYMMRSSYQHKSAAETSYPMAAMPGGPTPLVPEHEQGRLGPGDVGTGYRLFFDVQQCAAETDGTFDYTVQQPFVPRPSAKVAAGKQDCHSAAPPLSLSEQVVQDGWREGMSAE